MNIMIVACFVLESEISCSLLGLLLLLSPRDADCGVLVFCWTPTPTLGLLYDIMIVYLKMT